MYGSTLLGELRSFQPKVDSPDRVLPRLKSIRLLAIKHTTLYHMVTMLWFNFYLGPFVLAFGYV